jgi:hypothetical protein
MKNVILFIYLILIIPCTYSIKNGLSIVIEPTWKELQTNYKKHKCFDNQCILIGSITFNKRSADPVILSNLTLLWQGATINYLFGSLYKKSPSRGFLPIQQHLICDSTWKSKQQKLILSFEKKQALNAVDTFYLVLTIPKKLEQTVKMGKFILENTCLPQDLQSHINEQHLSLNLGIIKSITSPDTQ